MWSGGVFCMHCLHIFNHVSTNNCENKLCCMHVLFSNTVEFVPQINFTKLISRGNTYVNLVITNTSLFYPVNWKSFSSVHLSCPNYWNKYQWQMKYNSILYNIPSLNLYSCTQYHNNCSINPHYISTHWTEFNEIELNYTQL